VIKLFPTLNVLGENLLHNFQIFKEEKENLLIAENKCKHLLLLLLLLFFILFF
jgi:hypothetical protein